MDLDDFDTFRIATCDLNGQMRGKRMPQQDQGKLASGDLRMPLSALNVDIWGADIANSPLLFASGDGDGYLLPTNRGPVPMPWLDQPSALVGMWMFEEDGRPFEGDPRHALAQILDRYAARGWQVVAATELEFYLIDDSAESPRPPKDPASNRKIDSSAILSLQQLDAFEAFFSELYQSCAQMGINAQAASSEAGIGQFEISLQHGDALRIADDTWLFKTLLKGVARKHGYAASFMAKPYPNDAGNGLHLHFSVIDEAGENIFDDGTKQGSPLLQNAIAGCLATMRAATLGFAPHANSYARMDPENHAPTSICWGYENRTTALRIPAGAPSARRIEHRVAGGDINPFLTLGLILGAALLGIEDDLTPPPPITGNAYSQDLPQLIHSWSDAIDMFENDPMIARILPAQLIENFSLTKRQELDGLKNIPQEEHWKTYLETV